ncbi:hypothetical protein JOB18_027171 [Solea senegalensis]|uniref:Immunoglobulin domain-containing protein n=1 Tax=Solea senegalensis TaxID=28829 RepID=A0AAV6PPK2_SOLSE|nr:uncharacterized protein LOC122764875 [Solea senegalensis]KAG7471536.1 hypothetical protein JOB18_027171 [Solea senegalensis]
MVALSWILALLYATGSHQATASPDPRSGVEVCVGHNVVLTCNLSSGVDVTWWVVPSGSQLLQPLLTLVESKVGGTVVQFHTNDSHVNASVEAESVQLQVSGVREEDMGVYFCTGRCGGSVCFHTHFLTVTGTDVTSPTGEMSRPCWSAGICVLPASLVLIFFVFFGLYLWTGKSGMCRCGLARVTEDASLHYSSLRHLHQPRPLVRGQTHLVAEDVVYSTVNGGKNVMA